MKFIWKIVMIDISNFTEPLFVCKAILWVSYWVSKLLGIVVQVSI